MHSRDSYCEKHSLKFQTLNKGKYVFQETRMQTSQIYSVSRFFVFHASIFIFSFYICDHITHDIVCQAYSKPLCRHIISLKLCNSRKNSTKNLLFFMFLLLLSQAIMIFQFGRQIVITINKLSILCTANLIYCSLVLNGLIIIQNCC